MGDLEARLADLIVAQGGGTRVYLVFLEFFGETLGEASERGLACRTYRTVWSTSPRSGGACKN